MGVKDVWHLAGPCEERISLHSLRGSTLAVDLAGWVVSGNTAQGLAGNVKRPHLRNLFFRVNSLLSLDILPVVVLDGSCPDIKKATVAARNQQAWGAGSNTQMSPKRQQRSQFKGVLADCRRLLESLGVPCLVAPGEAEAYCAALNRAGIVDAVVSDDSDAFCYGAKTVLRNFSTDPKSFSVSRYLSSRLRAEVGLSRQRMVIMALLLGCDYNLGGVQGVGREAVTKLFSVWGQQAGEGEELERVVGWRVGALGEVVSTKSVHCSSCGHQGSVSTHRRSGCPTCGTSQSCSPSSGLDCPCDFHSPDNQAKLAELNIINKATVSPGWPFVKVVEEFYREFTNLPSQFSWTRPKPASFVDFCVRRLDWVREYCAEKLVETAVRWQVKNPANVLVQPLEIVKKRIRSGENMFEVQWASQDPTFPPTFLACVPALEFSQAYPAVYKDHLDKIEEKEAAKKKPKKKRKEKENIAPKEKKSKTKGAAARGQTKMDNFIEKIDPPEPEAKSLEPKVSLKPKSLVLRKLVSSDPKFNNLILGQQMVTPDTSEISLECQKVSENDKTDDYVFKRSDDHQNQSTVLSDSMRQYMDDDDDSDLSGIIDEIIGIKKPGTVKMKSFSTSTPTYNLLPPSLALPRHQSCSSPLLRKAQLNAQKVKDRDAVKPKASDVFDLSDVSLALNECSVSEEPNKPCDSLAGINFSEEASFDEFDCLDNSRQTPFAERVKKKMT